MYTTKISHMNLKQIANSGQCFRWQQISDNTYKIPAFGKEITISQDTDMFTMSCDKDEWNAIWKRYFDVGTDTNYDEVENIIVESNDDFLKVAYEFGGNIRILRQDLWEVIISFIISQNNNIPRIKKSIESLCDEVGGKFPNSLEILNMNLCNKGLGYRDEYLKDAASWWIQKIEANRSETKLKCAKQPQKHLLEIKGIGNKVADCICLFGLHHLEAFPIDAHIKAIIDREYNGGLPKWASSKYAGLFQQFIFYYEINKNKYHI